MKPTPLGPSLPGVPSPTPPPHKLELQTLKLEELTVSAGSNPPAPSPRQAGPLLVEGLRTLTPHKCPIGGPVARVPSPSSLGFQSSSPGPCLCPGAHPALPVPTPHPRSRSSGSSCACRASRCRGPSRCSCSACAAAPRPASPRSRGARDAQEAPLGHAAGLRPRGAPR